MIRRRMVDSEVGSAFGLITQDDHARVAGQLARHLGTSRYERPGRFGAFLAAVNAHDAGWPAHDRAPTINKDGYPSDVFESSREVSLKVWAGAPEVARREAVEAGLGEQDAVWAELLVSLHVLNLSGYALESLPEFRPTDRPGKRDAASLPARFQINKFQHREIERQEHLRAALGLNTEVALTLGLAEEGVDPREDEVRCALRWLQAMDVLSLGVCCTKPPMLATGDIHPAAGVQGEVLYVSREAGDLVVRPWPFAVESVQVTAPVTIVAARRYTSEQDLQDAMVAGRKTTLTAVVRAY